VRAKAKLRREKSVKRSAWHAAHGSFPHMIRHRSATDLRKGGGLEVAQVVLGHTNTKTTLRYAEADVERAHAVVERIG
jgi:site-specific recombinase XerD